LTKTSVFNVQVQFGDCDPAGIVFFPNFLRWMDAASLHFFRQQGVPAWSQITDPPGFVGTPLLEIHTRFVQSATYPDDLQIHTHIDSWAPKVIVQLHRVMRGDTLICEGRETRAFCARDATGRLRAIPIPAWIRELCE
jgi:4-hydroxybenzoyl-CoA thioesterase